MIKTLLLALFIGLLPDFSVAAKTIVHSVTPKDMRLLEKVDKKYQQEHGIHIDFKKTIVTALMGSSKSSQGEVWLNKGKMRLEIKKPEKSLMVAGSQYLWIESPPPPGFKDIKTQVLKASLNSKRAKSQGLIQLLTQGGVLKYFRVSGTQKEKGFITFFLQPDSQSIEFKRAQIKVDIKRLEIQELSYWDQIDNKTSFVFDSTQFNLKTKNNLFEYTPPKDAEVMTY